MSRRKHVDRPPRDNTRRHPGQPRDRHASVVGANPSAPRPLQIVEYDILDGDVGDPQSDVPEEIVEQVAEVWQLVYDDPSEAARRLEPLLEKYPNVPRLYNFLHSAYASSGQKDKAHEIAERNFRLHPNYLFAKIDCAADALSRGEPERVPEILGHKFDLKMMYPDRDAFHFSEFIGLQGVLAEYFLQVEDLDAARTCCDMLAEVAPDHPMVETLSNQLAIAVVSDALLNLATRRRKPSRKRPTRKRDGTQT